ncbi:MAG: hypothetical protein C0459_07480 [Chitinophaga sp.]|jgi:protein-tyrosine phosphatase|nr:hypothetical protein [Chitinophaga sp.]
MRITAICLFLSIIIISTKSNCQITDSSQRKVYLQGCVNFRDIGGYKTSTNKTVKWGKIYRSAEINKLTQQDINELEKRNITTDIDFRGLEEAKKAPDAVWKNVDYIRCGAGSETNMNWIQALRTATNGDSLMITYYEKIDSLGLRYKTLFSKLLTQKNNEAIVYHCTAGKDRTGIATALILYTLGVPMQKIFEDYEASNYYRQADNNRMIQMISTMGTNKNVAESIVTVKASFLQATLNKIITQYGSVDNFLEKELGIGAKEKAMLQSKFLE